MKMLSILLNIFLINPLLISSQTEIPLSIGGTRDDNNCLTSAGYSWCESSQQCLRIWETPCKDNYSDCNDCLERQRDGENIACPTKCDNIVINVPCSLQCRPPPCPMMPMMEGCRFTQPQKDSCGCDISCGSIDCQPQVSNQGETCGGFVMPGQQHICADGLECVNTMGPYIADAPGTCHPICTTVRDQWGNCVDDNCLQWNDGCNSCDVVNNQLTSCTESVCYSNNNDAHCTRISVTLTQQIPNNCASWYDGCNTCMVNNGQISGCTMMYCFTMNTPHCQSFTTDDLQENDICYRFCEDSSQTYIDRQNGCPSGTQCLSESTSLISFDSCGDRAKKCLTIKGH